MNSAAKPMIKNSATTVDIISARRLDMERSPKPQDITTSMKRTRKRGVSSKRKMLGLKNAAKKHSVAENNEESPQMALGRISEANAPFQCRVVQPSGVISFSWRAVAGFSDSREVATSPAVPLDSKPCSRPLHDSGAKPHLVNKIRLDCTIVLDVLYPEAKVGLARTWLAAGGTLVSG